MLHWREDDRDAAAAELAPGGRRVVAGVVAGALDLADLPGEAAGEPAEALARLDAYVPQDSAGMQRREGQALRLAITTGNLDRAPASPPSGSTASSSTPTPRSSSPARCTRLGMSELAEAVLSRARRRAGNQASALVGLMLQYQRQDKVDAAVQAALQILQSTTAVRGDEPGRH